MSSLFITGSSGFIGGNLLRRIDFKKYENIYCLIRTETKITTSFSQYDNLKVIRGSLYDANRYASHLALADTVIHLAAATGKVTPKGYFDVNAEGTEFLIKQCRQLGVQNFLYISSIAVKFQDKSQYYYAQSKQQGEDAVRNSGLNYTIVRPTIVIGRGSETWRGLSKLAKAPVVLMFGDGTARIQPIYVDDLVDCILSIVEGNVFLKETFDLGGPEEVTIENFLRRIHQMYYKKDPTVVHIPLRHLITVLSFMERHFYSLLPLNAGQLSSFSNDGTAETNRLHNSHLPRMKNVDEMLRLVINNE